MIAARTGNDYTEITKVFAGGAVQQEVIKIWSTDADDWVYEATDTVSGTLPLTFHADGSALVDYQVYGAPGGVGDRTENLFDQSTVTAMALVDNTTGDVISYQYYDTSATIDIETDFIVNFETNKNLAAPIRIGFYDEQGNYLGFIGSQNPISPYAVMIPTGTKKIRVSFSNGRYSSNAKMINIFVGSTAPASYEPYGYKLDMGVGSWSPYATHTGKIIDMTTGDENSSPQYSTAYFNNFFPNTAIITVKADTAGGGRTLRYMPYDENQAPMLDFKAEVQFIRDGRTVQLRVTIPSGAAYYGVSYHNGDTQKKISTATPIYIGDEPLEKINNYSDYVDYDAQKVVRAIKKLALTGEEGWYYRTGNPPNVFFFELVGVQCVNNCGRCTHYTNQESGSFSTLEDKHLLVRFAADGTKTYVAIRDSSFSYVENFMSYLSQQYAAGTPVTVWCALTVAEETDPPVPLPALPTCEGTTVIDYDGTPAPSSVYLKYKKGW